MRTIAAGGGITRSGIPCGRVIAGATPLEVWRFQRPFQFGISSYQMQSVSEGEMLKDRRKYTRILGYTRHTISVFRIKVPKKAFFQFIVFGHTDFEARR